MTRKGAQPELFLISMAVSHLEAGMYGNFNQPEAVKEAKKYYPDASIGFGPQKEHAAGIIDRALMMGEMSVFVLLSSTEREVPSTPLQVPPDVLRKIVRTRGGLPDHVIQNMSIIAKDPITLKLHAALSKSALYVRSDEYVAWYEKARKKGNWPSQRSRRKPRMGTPSKQSDLRIPIVALINEGRWSARLAIADLVRLLESKGRSATRDTARRTVDQLFRETGDQCYRRRVRKRSASK